MRRRQLLAITATSSLLVGGCSSDRDDSPEVGLGRITMTNDRQESIEVRVTVEKNGETVYDISHHLSARQNGIADGVEIVEEWMGEKTYYEVTVSIVETSIRKSFSTEDATDFYSEWGDHECFILSISSKKDDIYFAVGAMDSCP